MRSTVNGPEPGLYYESECSISKLIMNGPLRRLCIEKHDSSVCCNKPPLSLVCSPVKVPQYCLISHLPFPSQGLYVFIHTEPLGLYHMECHYVTRNYTLKNLYIHCMKLVLILRHASFSRRCPL